MNEDKILINDAYINFNIDKKAKEIKYQLNFILAGIVPINKAELQTVLRTIADSLVEPDNTIEK